jgi:hypothetical protein
MLYVLDGQRHPLARARLVGGLVGSVALDEFVYLPSQGEDFGKILSALLDFARACNAEHLCFLAPLGENDEVNFERCGMVTYDAYFTRYGHLVTIGQADGESMYILRTDLEPPMLETDGEWCSVYETEGDFAEKFDQVTLTLSSAYRPHASSACGLDSSTLMLLDNFFKFYRIVSKKKLDCLNAGTYVTYMSRGRIHGIVSPDRTYGITEPVV